MSSDALFKKKQDTRSPLEGVPLNTPGQSLHRQMFRTLMDPWILGLLALLFFLLGNYFANFLYLKSVLIYFAVMAGVLVVFIYRMRKIESRVEGIWLGIQGERWVGQFLETLREDGYQVFHDIQDERGNIDHVLVGPAGIFTVETKTISKKNGEQEKIRYDGRAITVGKREASDKCLIQARAEAASLKRRLRDVTGSDHRVQAIVVFPGWWVEHETSPTTHDVKVLNPKQLPGYLRGQGVQLDEREVRIICNQFSAKIREEIQRELDMQDGK